MTKSKILLVEDDKVLSKVIHEELRDANFEVSVAYDGESGLNLARKENPDLVLLDILLPKKNGFEVLGAMKKTPETKNIPVILLTMLGSDEDIKKGLQLGANDYIVKSQHALPEIVEKVKGFLAEGHHPKIEQLA